MTQAARRGVPTVLLALQVAIVGVVIWWLRSVPDPGAELRSPHAPAHDQYTRWVEGGDSATAELLASLRDGSGQERRLALTAIASLRQASPELRAALREVLQSSHPPDRREALLAWVASSREVGDCLPELQQATLDSDPIIRATAFDLLGDLGADAEPVLVEIARSSPPPQQAAALTGLLALPTHSPAAIEVAHQAWQPEQPLACRLKGLELLIASRATTPELLRPALQDPDRSLQELGLVGVRELGPPAATLLPELAEVNWQIAFETHHRQRLTGTIRQLPVTILNPNPAAAMAAVNQGEAVFPVFEELPTASPEVRFGGGRAVFGALAAVGPAARELAPRIAQESRSTPRGLVESAWTQSQLGVPIAELEGPLVDRLLADPPLGEEISPLLAHWKSPRLSEVVAALERTARDTKPERAEAWWRCVRGLGPEAKGLMSQICQTLDTPTAPQRGEVFAVIDRMGDEAEPLVPRLLALIGSADPVRPLALDTLARLGPVARSAEPLLLELLNADLATLDPPEPVPANDPTIRQVPPQPEAGPADGAGGPGDGARRLLKVGIPAAPGQRGRQQAAAALAALQPATYAPLEPLTRYLEPEAVDSVMQAFVLEALWPAAMRAGEEVALARLAWATGDETVRRRLLPLLERRGGDLPGRQALLRDWVGDWSTHGAVRRRSLESQVGDLAHPDPRVRVELELLRTLGHLDQGPAARQLLETRRAELQPLFPPDEATATPRPGVRELLRARRDLLHEIDAALHPQPSSQPSLQPASRPDR